MRAAEALLLALVAVAPWLYGGAPDTARFGLAAAVLLVAGAALAARAGAGPPLDTTGLVVFALPALAGLHALTGRTAYRLGSLDATLLLLAAAALVVFWRERARDPDAARRLLVTVVATCALQSAFGVWQWSVAPDRVYGRTTPFVTMPFGSYVNHNHFAGLVEMGALGAAGLAVASARRGRGVTPSAIGWAVGALGLTAAHLASRSRGGLIALTGGALVLAAGTAWSLSRRHRDTPDRPRSPARPIAAALFAVGVLLGFGLFALPEESRARLATVLRGPSDQSGSYRVEVARATLALFRAHPVLGAGIGAYEDAVPAFKTSAGEVRVTHAESDAIEWVAEAGLVGIALLAFVAARLAAGLLERLTRGRDPHRKALALAAAAAVAALLVHSLVDFNLRLPANAFIFASLLGAAAAPRQEPPGRPRALTAAIAAACLLGALAAGGRAIGAHALAEATAIPDPPRRIDALTGVLRWHPYLAEAWHQRGLAWRELSFRREGWVAARAARAEADLREALVRRPRRAEAWADLGLTLEAVGRRAEADEALARAVSLDPTHAEVVTARAGFLARAGRVDDAVRLVHTLVGRHMGWTPAAAEAAEKRLRAAPAERYP